MLGNNSELYRASSITERDRYKNANSFHAKRQIMLLSNVANMINPNVDNDDEHDRSQ